MLSKSLNSEFLLRNVLIHAYVLNFFNYLPLCKFTKRSMKVRKRSNFYPEWKKNPAYILIVAHVHSPG